MAVSKRTRYEILRRDNHTCRYCGGAAPDVKLAVDHVTPVSLGGSDDPTNLVAACVDCNAGKASSNPDAPLVAEVSESAIQWAEALKSALDTAATGAKEREAYRRKFRRAWNGWKFGGSPLDLPDDWSRTIDRWGAIPVPAVILEDAVRVAMATTTVHPGAKWKYFCGIVWRTLDDAREKVEATASPAAKASCGHCGGCLDGRHCTLLEGPDEDEDAECGPCMHCGKDTCLYALGKSVGDMNGWSHGYDAGRDALGMKHLSAIASSDLLTAVIDGGIDKLPEFIKVGV